MLNNQEKYDVCLSLCIQISILKAGWVDPTKLVSLAVNPTVRTAAETGRTNIFCKLGPGESGLANMFAISLGLFFNKTTFHCRIVSPPPVFHLKLSGNSEYYEVSTQPRYINKSMFFLLN